MIELVFPSHNLLHNANEEISEFDLFIAAEVRGLNSTDSFLIVSVVIDSRLPQPVISRDRLDLP